MADKAHTLVDGELRWAPLVWLFCLTAGVTGVLMLALASQAASLAVWGPCCGIWSFLAGSNALFVIRHRRPTVGMVPVAAASLLPASLAALTAGVLMPVNALLAAGSFAVSAHLAFWFFTLHGAYAHREELSDDCVIVVLGAAVRNGVPSTTLRLRLETAEEACADAPERLLVLTGGPAGNGGTEADVMAQWLQARGIRRDRLLLEPQARNTAENIQRSWEAVCAHGLQERQLSVVTSDYHLYRALQEGRRQRLDLVPLPARTPLASRLQQWCREVVTIVYERRRSP